MENPRNMNTLSIAHNFLSQHVKQGDFVIDATAGRGRDTLFLTRLVGISGRVIAFDIQGEAIAITEELLLREEPNLFSIVRLAHDSHSNMHTYTPPDTVDAIVFNFGYLPGGRHDIFTLPDTSIAAITHALELLKLGGVACLCIYYGGDTGYEERDALLEFLKTVDSYRYTVLLNQFWNRKGDPAIPVFIFKHLK